jgi:hypothetical protein
MNTEQTEIQERMRNRAMGRVVNALNALKYELASQGHDTSALTLEAVMTVIEPKEIEPTVILTQPHNVEAAQELIRSTRKAK